MSILAATGNAVALVAQTGEEWRSRLVLRGSLRRLAIDPSDSQTVYAGGQDGIAKTIDGGESWVDLATPAQDVFSLAVSPADGAVYAGCEPSSLFRSDDGGTSWTELASLREIPSAPTWSFPPRPWTSHVSWIAPSPHDPDRLLAGIELGGVMLSEDGGETWSDHRPGAQKDVHALAWHPTAEGRAYEAGGGGAAWSSDRGRTWQAADRGRDRHYTVGLAVDPDDPDCWFVSASPGPWQAHRVGHAEAYVYRWRGDGQWQRLENGLPQPLDAMPYALAFGSDRLFAGLGDGRIYASFDAGDSWMRLPITGDPPSAISALVAG